MPRKSFNTSLDAELIDWLKIQAVTQHTDVNKILEQLIRDYREQIERGASDGQ